MDYSNQLGFEIRDLDGTQNKAVISIDKVFAARLRGRLEPYKSLPRTFRPALEQIADYVRMEMIPRTFDQEGPGWIPLAPRTVGERIAAGYSGEHPILMRTRDLFKELTDRSHPKHIEVVRVGKHARIEIGGSSKKFIENQMGVPAQHLPARPMIPGTGYLPIPDRDRKAIKSILMKALKK